MREPTNMELYQEIERLREEIKNNKQDNSYQDFTNSLIQLSIAHKLGAITLDMYHKLSIDCAENYKQYFKNWSKSQRENASALMKDIKKTYKPLKKDESTNE